MLSDHAPNERTPPSPHARTIARGTRLGAARPPRPPACARAARRALARSRAGGDGHPRCLASASPQGFAITPGPGRHLRAQPVLPMPTGCARRVRPGCVGALDASACMRLHAHAE